MKRIRSLVLFLLAFLALAVPAPLRASSPVVDVSANSPYLYQYVFTSVSGTATLTGIYVDFSGTQIGAAVSYSITTATTLTSLAAGGVLPSGATGFIGTLSASVYEGLGGLPSGAIAAGQSPTAGYPVVTVGNSLQIGRISSSAAAGAAAAASAGVPAVAWTDHSTSACTANAWTQFTASSSTRRELDFYLLAAPGTVIYIAFTATNVAPTGTPSTTTNSSPGAIPVSLGWQTNVQGAINGYGWYYCTSSVPFTEEEF